MADEETTPEEPAAAATDDATEAGDNATVIIGVYDGAPEGYDGSCLRPLGLCELGGCCDACWYSPDHPRFNK